MATEIHMPRLGWTMEEAAFGGWLKRDGDAVAAGEPLFSVDADKATQEVEAIEGGVLHIPPDAPVPGDIVLVGALLGYLLQPGEAAPFELRKPAQAGVAVAHAPQVQASTTAGPPAVAQQRNRRATPRISPRARRAAADLGVDWTQVAGSGRSGRIVERDIRAAARPPAQPQLAEAPAALPTQAEAGETIPISRVRRLIAQRMVAGVQAAAPVTLTTEADATKLVALREQLKTTFDARDMLVPTYNDLLIKLTATALQEHRLLNAVWREDAIFIPDDVHMALAVESEEGLLAPVVRAAQTKSVRQIAAETRALIEKVRTGRITPEELQGGTFTLTNLGAQSIDAFTPIIHLPQCAILGVGRIAKKPAVYQDAVVPRQRVTLSLTFDHRVVDGGPAARFLDAVRQYVEEPVLWLV